jgi:hypothetical protein
MPGGQGFRGLEIRHQVRRNHQVPHPQRGEQHFAEAAGKEHQPVAVEPLQRRHRTPRTIDLALRILGEQVVKQGT